jgi:hypothetical protein
MEEEVMVEEAMPVSSVVATMVEGMGLAEGSTPTEGERVG